MSLYFNSLVIVYSYLTSTPTSIDLSARDIPVKGPTPAVNISIVQNEILDIDADKVDSASETNPNPIDSPINSTMLQRCKGYKLTIHLSESPHMVYPFALHQKFLLLWDYEFSNSTLWLCACTCYQHPQHSDKESCHSCLDLIQDSILQGIEDHIRDGIHENAGLAYYGFAGIMEIVQQKY